jgi:hypothetical protein
MATRQRTVPPGTIKNLSDWLARWPKATNVGFDPTARNPVVYTADDTRRKVLEIPWRREFDTISVLITPSRHSPQVLAMAKRRYTDVKELQSELISSSEEQLREAEEILLEAWAEYESADLATKRQLITGVMEAERVYADLEKEFVKQRTPGSVSYIDKRKPKRQQYGIYTPPMAVSRRGLPLTSTSSNTNTNTNTNTD